MTDEKRAQGLAALILDADIPKRLMQEKDGLLEWLAGQLNKSDDERSSVDSYRAGYWEGRYQAFRETLAEITKESAMKDYTKDRSVPLPIASLLNAAQDEPPNQVSDSLGWYAHQLGAAEAEIKKLREWAHDEQKKREAVEDSRLRERQASQEAIKALRYLADHSRPIGGQSGYNAEHLSQIADTLEGAGRANG